VTLEQLEALRAARLDPQDLPHTTTMREAMAYGAETAAIDHRLATAKAALATLAELSDETAESEWLDRLNAWRTTLCDELLAILSPVRDKQLLARKETLTLSIRCIDVGPGVFRDTGYALETSALGALMREAGYEVAGADLTRNFVGALPWHGSVRETERRLKDRARRRAIAQAQLDAVLLDEAERKQQEARSKALREAANALDIRIGADGGLRVVGANNEAIDESTLTPLQREALDFTRRAFATSA
jgi:hypothetical protein